jgi:hypothetical protein
MNKLWIMSKFSSATYSNYYIYENSNNLIKFHGKSQQLVAKIKTKRQFCGAGNLFLTEGRYSTISFYKILRILVCFGFSVPYFLNFKKQDNKFN